MCKKNLLFIFYYYVLLSHLHCSIVKGEELENNVKKNFEVQSNKINDDKDFRSVTYVLFDILQYLPVNNISVKCSEDIRKLEDAIHLREIWAIKALEASAVIPSNFLYGNHFWLGSKDECDLINNPAIVTFIDNHYKDTNNHLLRKPTGLEFAYKVIWANITRSPLQADNRYFRNKEILHLGLCLPITCTNNDVQIISSEYLSNNETLPKRVYEIEVNNIEVNDLTINSNFFYKKSLVLSGIIISFSVIAIGLSVTPLQQNLNCKVLFNILSVFHPKNNLITIFAPRPTEFPELNGLKFAAAVIILLFHVQYFGVYKLTSRFNGFVYSETFQMQIITNGALFVEVFFVMSGFLLAYNFLKNQKQTEILATESFKGILKFIFINLFKRLVRIVPLYIVIMLLTELASTYFGDTSVIKLWDEDGSNCRNYWWRNLLFIQNLFSHYDMCLNWSWTIACEMQFYIYATLLYIFYCKNERGAKICFFTTCGFVTVISTYFLVKHDFAFSFDSLFKAGSLDETYQHPLSRASPYLIGIGMAYYLVKCDNSISKYSANTIWILILMLLPISCTCTLYRDTPSWLAISMVAPLKWVFPFCFGWIILSPRLGHKNFVTKALAHNMFYHFGHMAYSFYLLNPLILIIVNGASNNPVPVDAAQLLVATFGICLMTFIFSIICTISIEMPCIKLLRIYTSQPKNNEVSSKSELQVKV